MAHALWEYDGPCRNVHGHSYRLFVTLTGTPGDDEKDPKNGMVMDFGDLKQLVKDHIIDKLDHALLINQKAPAEQLKKLSDMFSNVRSVPYQPTCENLLVDFAGIIKALLPGHVKLHSMKLAETATSYAEWFAEDQ